MSFALPSQGNAVNVTRCFLKNNAVLKRLIAFSNQASRVHSVLELPSLKNHNKIKQKRQKEAKNASECHRYRPDHETLSGSISPRHDRFEKSLLNMSINSISLLSATNWYLIGSIAKCWYVIENWKRNVLKNNTKSLTLFISVKLCLKNKMP